jgi:hypothetical protein
MTSRDHEISIVAPDARILSRAAQPFPTSLGTLDAVHLATALACREGACSDLV